MNGFNSQQRNEFRKKIEDFSYGLSDQIGKGFSSTVYKGMNEKTREAVAIKVIDIKGLKTKENFPLFKQMLDCEIDALRKLSHPNILRFHEVYNTVNNCYIITEFCTEGDLANLLKKRERLSELQAIPIIRDIYKGFHYLSSKGYLHRDLKPANILIKDGVYKIADFGFARRDNGLQIKEQFNVGTPLYMSPETLKNNVYTVKNDIWSLGIIFYEMLHGTTPWECKSQKELLEKITKVPCTFSRSLTDDLKDFIRRCLAVDEDRRMSLTEMEMHPFVHRINKTVYADEYQSNPPPLLHKISSNNAENKEPRAFEQPALTKDERRTRQQMAVTSQIYFMRYLFRLTEYVPRSTPLHFIIVKQLLSTLEALKQSFESKNIFGLDGWDEFLASDKSKKVQQVVGDYTKKYGRLYAEVDQYIARGIKDKKIAAHLDRNFQRNESLILTSIRFILDEIKQVYRQLINAPILKQISDDSVLPEAEQKMALRLDFVISYYQLNCLCLDNFSDVEYFSRTSKVEQLTDLKPCPLQKVHLKEIELKMRELEIIP